MEKSGNQEPQQTQLPDDIEVTSDIEVTQPEAITDIELTINLNNEATTVDDTTNTLEPPKINESPGTTEEIPVQALPTTQNISQPRQKIPGVLRYKM